MALRLPYRYYPRTYQAQTFGALQSGCLRFMDIEHRRAGKSRKWLNIMIMAAYTMRVGTYAYVLPEVKQAREVIWEGIGGDDSFRYLDHFPERLLYKPPNKAEMSVTLRHPLRADKPGSRIVLLGTDRNVNAVVGMNPVGIVWDEWAMQDPQARRFARPILAENKGWESVCFTPRGENHAYELHAVVQDDPLWFVQRLTVDDTRRDNPYEDGAPVVTEAAIDQDRREGMDEATIQQEYYLSWTAPMPGAYYAKELLALAEAQRITTVDYDPSRPVDTYWDIGTSVAHDTNSIWFVQQRGNQVRVIDFVHGSNEGFGWYCDKLAERPYHYRKHGMMEGDLDAADWGTGKTRVETAKAFGIRFTPVPKLPIIDGINAVREILPRCVFDDEKCRYGLNGLRGYRRLWDEAKKTFANTPVHDWASHPADAFRYLAVGIADGELPVYDRRYTVPRSQQHGINFDPHRVGVY